MGKPISPGFKEAIGAVHCRRAWRRASIEQQKPDRASEDQEGNLGLDEKAERTPSQEDRNRANGGKIEKAQFAFVRHKTAEVSIRYQDIICNDFVLLKKQEGRPCDYAFHFLFCGLVSGHGK